MKPNKKMLLTIALLILSPAFITLVNAMDSASQKFLEQAPAHNRQEIIASTTNNQEQQALARARKESKDVIKDAIADQQGESLVLKTLDEKSGGHTQSVESVAFSPDGNTLASGSWDQTIKIWDFTTSEIKLRTTLQGHTLAVLSVAFSPDGTTLASGSLDETIKIWDLSTPSDIKLQTTLTGHTGSVSSVAFSPDGKTLASGSADNTIKIWDLSTPPDIKLQTTLTGHTGSVRSVAFSPVRKTLASGSSDKTIKIWDLTTPDIKLQTTLQGHTQSVYSVAFNPKDTTLASSSWDRTIKIWDFTTGSLQATLEDHKLRVESLTYSPDGKVLASGSIDKTIKIWDLATPNIKLQKTLQGHTKGVVSVSFSTDGITLASGSSDKTIKIWRFFPDPSVSSSQKEPLQFSELAQQWQKKITNIRALKGHAAPVISLSITDDGNSLISTSRDGTRIVWDLKLGTVLKKFQEEPHKEALTQKPQMYSNDGSLLILGNDNGSITIKDVKTGTLLTTLNSAYNLKFLSENSIKQNASPSPVRSIAISNDGNQIFQGNDNGTIYIWQIPAQWGNLSRDLQKLIIKTTDIRERQALAVASKESKEVVEQVTGGYQRAWVLLKTLDTSVLLNTWDSKELKSIAFSPDGKNLASGSKDGVASIWDLTTNTIKFNKDYPKTRTINSVVFSPDGKTLAVSNPHLHLIDLHETINNFPYYKIYTRYYTPLTLAFSPDNNMLASGFQDGAVFIYNMKPIIAQKAHSYEDYLLAELTGHTKKVNSVAFSPDGKTLASGSEDETIKLWDLESSTLKATLRGHKGSVKSVAFSPDGRILASASEDETIKLWDLESSTLKLTLNGHKDSVNSVAFSPDGKILASASDDYTIKIWNCTTPDIKLQATLKGHQDKINSVAFSPYGKMLASASDDQTIKIWGPMSTFSTGDNQEKNAVIPKEQQALTHLSKQSIEGSRQT